MNSRNAKPASRPMTGATTDEVPSPISIAGISSDHTEAATITPDAKPSRTFCTSAGISRFMKNTKADPRAVPRNGIINAVNTGLMRRCLFDGHYAGPVLRSTEMDVNVPESCGGEMSTQLIGGVGVHPVNHLLPFLVVAEDPKKRMILFFFSIALTLVRFTTAKLRHLTRPRNPYLWRFEQSPAIVRHVQGPPSKRQKELLAEALEKARSEGGVLQAVLPSFSLYIERRSGMAFFTSTRGSSTRVALTRSHSFPS